MHFLNQKRTQIETEIEKISKLLDLSCFMDQIFDRLRDLER